MALLKCKMCGGDLEIAAGTTVAECEYCGTKQTLPKANDEVVQNLFNRANNLRIKCEFDKAEQIYEKILQQNDAEPEAHWGIVLCKYGIEYVEDPKTYKRIPTCHRTSYDAVTADADYQAAIEYADAVQRSIYETEAKAIDEIQKNILNIVKNEKPFDVFLCYKETDENGKRTVDSAIANDIYYQLTQEGYKVFYAPITLEDKLGQEYEPYIFAALDSAKVMLVIGTKPQYFSAVWVKNEWNRFLKLIKTDRSKLLIPCYRDMDAYDLPEEFAHLQAQDMGKIGFINDVVRGMKKLISTPAENSPIPPKPEAPTSTSDIGTAPEEFVEIYDTATFSKPQKIFFLIAALAALALQVLLIPQSGKLDSALTTLFWGICFIAFIVLSIRLFRQKAKDLSFIVLAMLAVIISVGSHFTPDGPILPLLLLGALFLCAPCFIPALSSKLKWVRFFFWAPPLIAFLLQFIGLHTWYGGGFALVSWACLLPFMFSISAPIKRKTTRTITLQEYKKTNLKNGIALLIAAVLSVSLIPSVWLYADAEDSWQAGSYTRAIELYEKSHLKSEKDLLEIKYQVATDESVDSWTRKVLISDLAAEDYRDADELWEEITKWRVELVGCSVIQDHDNNLEYIPRNNNFLSISFTLYGGKNGEYINVSHRVTWPGEGIYTSSWNWENVGDGYPLGFEYSGGYSSNQTGNLVVEFFNSDTGELIDTVTIPIR